MSDRPRTVVLVSGDGSNLQAILDHWQRGALAIDVVGVISDRPGIRALERAAAAGVPTFTVPWGGGATRAESASRLGAVLEQCRPGLVVLAGFMRILEPSLVDAWAGRMLNVHPSLLPKYPGLHTYRRVLEAGDREHGTTVHFVIPELDAGPGIIQYRIPVREEDDEASLRERIRAGEHRVYPRAIAWVAAGRAVLKGREVWLDGAPLAGPVIVDEQ